MSLATHLSPQSNWRSSRKPKRSFNLANRAIQIPSLVRPGRTLREEEFKPSWYADADVAAHSERRYHPGQQAVAARERDQR